MKTSFLQKVEQNICSDELLLSGDSVLVAVSGGADSVCLLDVLSELKKRFSLSLHVAHLNHELRGDEALRDQMFVKSLCERYDVPFHTKNVNIGNLARSEGITIEEAGRNARYAFFTEIAKSYHLKKIATAHNKNDNIETVCMRFVRGTGLKGLCGIPVKNGNIIRPLLNLSREEIEDYLKLCNLSYVTDSTNLTADYTRNKIRLEMIPYIYSNLNIGFMDTLSDNLRLYSETEHFLETYTEEFYRKIERKHVLGVMFSVADILSADKCIAKRLIRKSVAEVTHSQLSQNLTEQIYFALQQEKHAVFQISVAFSVHVLYGKMYVIKTQKSPCFSARFATESVEISEIGAQYQLAAGINTPAHFPANTLYLKADLAKDKLLLRPRQNGDRIYLGNCGTKKIKDILIDQKIPSFERDFYPVLLYENEIIWLCGIRCNPKYLASPGEPFIQITYTKEKNYA